MTAFEYVNRTFFEARTASTPCPEPWVNSKQLADEFAQVEQARRAGRYYTDANTRQMDYICRFLFCTSTKQQQDEVSQMLANFAWYGDLW